MPEQITPAELRRLAQAAKNPHVYHPPDLELQIAPALYAAADRIEALEQMNAILAERGAEIHQARVRELEEGLREIFALKGKTLIGPWHDRDLTRIYCEGAAVAFEEVANLAAKLLEPKP